MANSKHAARARRGPSGPHSKTITAWACRQHNVARASEICAASGKPLQEKHICEALAGLWNEQNSDRQTSGDTIAKLRRRRRAKAPRPATWEDVARGAEAFAAILDPLSHTPHAYGLQLVARAMSRAIEAEGLRGSAAPGEVQRFGARVAAIVARERRSHELPGRGLDELRTAAER